LKYLPEYITSADNKEIKEEKCNMAEEIKEGAEEIQKEGGEESKMEPVVIKKPLEKMTAIELREMAMTIPGAVGVSAMKKEELVPLIREYMVIKEEFVSEPKAKKIKKPKANISELKAKVMQLKTAKKAAQENKEKEKVDVLRRRINRLKKQTRKVVVA